MKIFEKLNLKMLRENIKQKETIKDLKEINAIRKSLNLNQEQRIRELNDCIRPLKDEIRTLKRQVSNDIRND